jgi:hypothetical protein
MSLFLLYKLLDIRSIVIGLNDQSNFKEIKDSIEYPIDPSELVRLIDSNTIK